MNYRGRREALDLPTLEERRIREDMTTTYRILRGHDDVNMVVL